MIRALALVFLVAACNDDPLPGLLVDMAPAPDLSAPLCTTHVYEAVALASLAVDPTMPVAGATFRITIGVPLREGCDALGNIDVGVSGDAHDWLTIVAHRWRQIGGACPAETTRAWPIYYVTGDLGNNVLVRDGAQGGTLTVPIMIVYVSHNCSPTADPKCEQDCQCVSGRACVVGICATPCAEDVDCPASAPDCSAGTCEPPTGPCDCGFGQQCNKSGVCGLAQDQTHWGAKCACDGDCGFGAVCGGGICRLPCVTVRDCPNGPWSSTCDPVVGCTRSDG